MTETTTKLGMCQVRSKTERPCLHRAVVEIRGIPFCEACAREQEAYFAIGELTRETHDLRSESLAEALDEMRRERTSDIVAARHHEFPGVDETGHFALTKS